MTKIFTIAILTLLAFNRCAYADALGTLIDVGKSQSAMGKALDRETKAYDRIKRGIETGCLKKGQTANEVRSEYGDPVVVSEEKDGTSRWVYKPGYASHFDGIKINLLFDKEKKLAKIEVLNRSK